MQSRKLIPLLISLVFLGSLAAAQPQITDFKPSDKQLWLDQKNPEVSFQVEGNFSDIEYNKDFFKRTASLEFQLRPNISRRQVKNLEFTVSEGNKSDTEQVKLEDLGFATAVKDGELNYGETFTRKLMIYSPENPKGKPRENDASLLGGQDFDIVGQYSKEIRLRAPQQGDGSSFDRYDLKLSSQSGGRIIYEDVKLQKYSVSGLTTLLNNKQVESVYYRDLLDAKFKVKVNKRGQGYPDLGAENFNFMGEKVSTETNWLEVKYNGGGEYILTLNGRPQFQRESINKVERREYSVEVVLPNDRKVNLKDAIAVEKWVRFSGKVYRLRDNSWVETDFYADFGEKTREFSTNPSGKFNFYTPDGEAEILRIDFPKGGFSLSKFEFLRTGSDTANNRVDNIRYKYYQNPQKKLDLNIEGFRPINLMSAKLGYNFEAGKNTEAYMEYDTTRVDNHKAIQVYECTYWQFEPENCAGQWNKIKEDKVGFYSTDVPSFPVTPLSSDSFRGVNNILSNAYVVGIPKGYNSGLTLEGKGGTGLKLNSARLKSGKELRISGKVIDKKTGKPVKGADVDLSLQSDSETIELSAETMEDGTFRFAKKMSEVGNYTVNIKVTKDPYEDFQMQSDNKIKVYYEKGLSVSSEDNPTIKFGGKSTVDFEITNSGQASVEDIKLEISGLNNKYYSLESGQFTELGSGESKTVEVILKIPEDYCSKPCTDPPEIKLMASGTSAGEKVKGKAKVITSYPQEYKTVPRQTDAQNQQNSNNNKDGRTQGTQTGESSTTDSSDTSGNESSFTVPSAEEVSKITGNFIQSQSDMNLALGIILLFGLVLAVAVRKRNDSEERETRTSGRGNGRQAGGAAAGRGKVQRPDVSPNRGEEDDGEKAPENKTSEEDEKGEKQNEDGSEEDESSDVEEDSDGGDSGSEFVCDTCGDGFDTESGLKLHRQALH